MTHRFVVEPVVLGGQQLQPGDDVLLCNAAANGGAAVFKDPERLDIGRDLSRSIVFGQGPHFCIGAQLARTEIRLLLEYLLDTFLSSIRVVDSGVRYRPANPISYEIAQLPLATGLPQH